MKCELSRRRLDGSVRRLKSSTVWVPTAWRLALGSGRLFVFVLPVARFFFTRRAPAPAGLWQKWKMFREGIGRKLSSPVSR